MKSQKRNFNLIIFLLVLVLSLYFTNEYTITQRKVFIKISKENLENIETTERITYNFSSSEISKLKSQSKPHLKDSKDSSSQFLNLPIKKSIMIDKDTPITNFIVLSKNSNFKASISGNIKSFAKHDQNAIIPLKQYAIDIIPDSSLKSKDYKFDLEYSYNVDYQNPTLEKNDSALRKSSLNKEKNNENKKLKEPDNIAEDSRRLTIPLSTFDEAKEIESNAELFLQFVGFKNGIKLEENDKENKVFSSSTVKNDVTEYKINVKLLNNSNKNININFIESQADISKLDETNSNNVSNDNYDNNIKTKQTNVLQIKQENKVNSNRHKQYKSNSNSNSNNQDSSGSPLTNALTIIYLTVLLFFVCLCWCFSTTEKEFEKSDTSNSNNLNNNNNFNNNNTGDNNNNDDALLNKEGNFNVDAGHAHS